ncbi:hypothetical protein H4R19_004258, partial [Coemansia spiralis]
RRAGIGASATVQVHPPLYELSLRTLTLCTPAAHSEKAPSGGELEPELPPKPCKRMARAPLPAQVVGNDIIVGSDFLSTLAGGGFIVDKSLICKVLLAKLGSALRICLPRRFGKSFNLAVIAQFFNPVTVHDWKGYAGKPDFDAARERRRQLFTNSFLGQHHADFVEKYFGKIPVIQIDFAGAGSASLGAFYGSLTTALHNAATFWVDAYMDPALLNDDARTEYKILQSVYSTMGARLKTVNDTQWKDCGNHASGLFSALSGFLAAQHGKYIILVDEYDQPMEAALENKWQAAANEVYLGLLRKMFKGNTRLVAGLLIGVHEFDLSDRQSGLNNAMSLSLTTGRYCADPLRPLDINDEDPGPLGELFAFTVQDVEALVKRMLEVSEDARDYSQQEVMDAIASRYDGYDFGYPTKRYNPWSVLKFLERVAIGAKIKDAATSYWTWTSNVASFARLAWRHREEILQLAPPLLNDYDIKAIDSCIRVTSQDGKGVCVMPAGDFQRVHIGKTTYPSSRTSLRGTGELVTLLVHLGYLTMGPGNVLRIPNGELRTMWETTCLSALLNTETHDERDISRERLISQLFDGDISGLAALMRDAIRCLANSNKHSYLELTCANLLRKGLSLVFGAGPHAVILNKPGSGDSKADIILELSPLSRAMGPEDRLVVVIEMKHITYPDKKAMDKADPKEAKTMKCLEGMDINTLYKARAKGNALALKAVNQIIEKGYAQVYQGWPRQMDIGIAIGKGMVMETRHR